MKYDISWIMQSYLGEYPGSRADSDKKFIRAVKSFLAIGDPRSQLVIASDNCEITHALYYKHFKKYENISYVFVDKSVPNMYEKIEDQSLVYYRGVPREAARAISEGYLIAYMDSDDYILPTAAQIIKSYWNGTVKEYPDANYKWAIIGNWYDNVAFIEKYPESTFTIPVEEPIKIKGLKSKWQKQKMSDGNVLSSTWGAIHKHNCNTKWLDVISDRSKGEASEDSIFWRKLREEGNGFLINDGFYVRCHYNGIWDY